MNGRIVAKPLYVALAQRKEDRKAHLASQYIQRMAGMRMQQMGGMQQMGMGGYFMPMMPQPQRFFTPAQIRAQPRWPQQQAVPRPGGYRAKEFATKELLPNMSKWDQHEIFPVETLRK